MNDESCMPVLFACFPLFAGAVAISTSIWFLTNLVRNFSLASAWRQERSEHPLGVYFMGLLPPSRRLLRSSSAEEQKQFATHRWLGLVPLAFLVVLTGAVGRLAWAACSALGTRP